jgi:hypothetical protein
MTSSNDEGKETYVAPANDSHSPTQPATKDGAVVAPPHISEKRLLWKIDRHVIPFLCVMYLLAFLGEHRPLAPCCGT